MNLNVAVLLAALTGFISLSYEIVLYRAVSLGLYAAAIAFPLLLGAYLLGIAIGARGSRSFSHDERAGSMGPLRSIAGFITASNLLAFLSTAGIGWMAGAEVFFGFWLLVVAVASAMLGAQFPLIAHYGVEPNEQAGQRVSYLYGANIVGSTLGSLITGVFVLDHLSLSWAVTLLYVIGTTAGIVLYLATKPEKNRQIAAIVTLLVLVVVGVASRPALFDQYYEKLFFKGSKPGITFDTVIENKYGVITVDNEEVIYGNGIYDGGFNVDPRVRTNHILRAYSIGLFHPKPKRVMMVGLSSGSWATVVANHPDLEELVVIEINPGYLDILEKRADRRPLLDHPKVRIVIDDGRRWLARNPDEKFDVVLANHSHHWRSLATNLLSKEYNDLVREHLNPGGVYIYNTTTSPRVFRTAFATWEHVQRFQSCAVASDVSLEPNRQRWAEQLRNYSIWGEQVIPASDADVADRIAARVVPKKTEDDEDHFENFYETRDDLWERVKDREVITDDNMGTEWSELVEP